MILKEYAYKPKWTTVFLAGGFFGLCTALFVSLALTDNRGMIINGIIPLSPFGAKVFYWILAAASFAFVIGAGFLAFVRLTNPQRIAVTDDGMLFPAGRWTGRECHVPFRSVTAVKQVEVHGQVFLYVYAEGLRYTVLRDMLPGKRDFDEIVSLLGAKAEGKGDSHQN